MRKACGFTCEEALLDLFKKYNGHIDPNTGNPIDYQWKADSRNWPHEIVWQQLTANVFKVRLYIPWQEMWSSFIWSSESIRRTMQKIHAKGLYLPQAGPIFDRRVRILKKIKTERANYMRVIQG